MDLLTGYGSDSDGSVSSSTAQVPKSDPSLINSASCLTAIDPNLSSNAAKSKVTSAYRKKRKLLSLNAVLPPEIFERLTRSVVQTSGSIMGSVTRNFDGTENGYLNSSSDEEDDTNYNNKKRGVKEGTSSNGDRYFSNINKNDATSSDKGLNSLLFDLKNTRSLASVGKAKTENNGVGNLDTAVSKCKAKVEKEGKEKLGVAFMETSTTVIRRKKANVINNDRGGINDHVENIHDSASRLMSNNTKNDSKVYKKKKMDEKTLVNQKTIETSSFQHSKQSTTVESDVTNRNVVSRLSKIDQLPRPSLRNAAPISSIIAAPNNALHPSQLSHLQKQRSNYQQPQQPQQPQGQGNHCYANQQPFVQEEPIQPFQEQTNQSHKELEKALRSGNFAVFDSTNVSNVTTISQPMLHYTPSHVPQNNSHNMTFSNKNMQTYNPKEGSTSLAQQIANTDADGAKVLSQRQRSKHQIHSLIANAASLQAKRSQVSEMGLGGVGVVKKGNSSRADAKKRYGW